MCVYVLMKKEHSENYLFTVVMSKLRLNLVFELLMVSTRLIDM